MGADTALQVAIRHPELVRKLVPISGKYRYDGEYPELLAGIQQMTPDIFAGTPYEDAYLRHRAEPGGLPAAGREDQGVLWQGVCLARRGHPVDRGADAADHRRFRHRPPRARDAALPPPRGRRARRYDRSAQLPARHPPWHHARHDRLRTRRPVAGDDRGRFSPRRCPTQRNAITTERQFRTVSARDTEKRGPACITHFFVRSRSSLRLVSLLGGGFVPVLAQDAAPASASGNPFADLGLPEIAVTITDNRLRGRSRGTRRWTLCPHGDQCARGR